MRPTTFDLLRPRDVTEALDCLRGAGPDAWLVAGGQALLKQMRARLVAPRRLIDISALRELAYVRSDGDAIEIGAITPLAVIAADPLIQRRCQGLAEAALRVGDPQIRSRATVAGNICTGGSSDVGVALAAAGGEVVVRSVAGERRVPAAEFLAAGERPGNAGELIVALRFGTAAGSAYEKLSRRTADPALASAAAFVSGRPGRMALGLALGGVHAHVVRAAAVEDLAAGGGADAPGLTAALTAFAERLAPPDTPHAGAAYRRRVLPIVALRAIRSAFARANGA